MFNDPVWGKWHYTEGSGSFTACGSPVVLWAVDGSPEEKDNLGKVTCKRCLALMRKAGVHSDSPENSAVNLHNQITPVTDTQQG